MKCLAGLQGRARHLVSMAHRRGYKNADISDTKFVHDL